MRMFLTNNNDSNIPLTWGGHASLPWQLARPSSAAAHLSRRRVLGRQRIVGVSGTVREKQRGEVPSGANPYCVLRAAHTRSTAIELRAGKVVGGAPSSASLAVVRGGSYSSLVNRKKASLRCLLENVGISVISLF